MSPTPLPTDPEVDETQDEQESPPPACVLSFNASDASGAGGLAGDVATIAAMGAHCLPVVTAVVLRDTAEVFEHENLDPDTVAEKLETLQRVTAADELVVTSVTHWHADRLRSHELLAKRWGLQ